jgi:hypothetical protein
VIGPFGFGTLRRAASRRQGGVDVEDGRPRLENAAHGDRVSNDLTGHHQPENAPTHAINV